MPDDVIVPKEVEHRIRALHPPEQHEAELENARGFYRTLREDRRQELRAMREPDPIRLEPSGPSPGQQARIKAHSERKKKWRRKPRRIKYPVNTYPAGYPSEITGSEAMAKSMRLPDKSIVRFRTVKRAPGAPVPSRIRTASGHWRRRESDVVEARHKGQEVGHMRLWRGNPNSAFDRSMSGTVVMVDTVPHMQRKGIATGMWQHAKKRGLDPQHSESQTIIGQKWAAAVGKSYEVGKSEIMPGVFKPITRVAYGGGREAEPAVRAAVASRVRGDLVYHGGTKGRIKKLVRRGTAETEKGTGFGQSKGSGKGLVFTTPSRSVAQGYAVAGRTEKEFGQRGDLDMNKRIVARGKGSIASFNMKGQWPKAVYHGSNGPELLYTPKQLQQGRHTVQGQKPHRTRQYKSQRLTQEVRDRHRLRARALHAKGVPVAPGDRQGERYRRFLEEGDPLHTKAEESDIARRAMLRGEKTPKQLREEEFDRLFGKSYEDDLRAQFQAKAANSRWAAEHPEWVAQHKRISSLSADEKKAKVSAGRKKVDPNKILKPIRMDEGTVPTPERKHRLARLIHRKREQVGKAWRRPEHSVVVTGSRDISEKDRKRIRRDLSRTRMARPHKRLVVHHGGASGADDAAGEWAWDKKVDQDIHRADWAKHGRAAGPIRNKQMLQHARPNKVFAYPKGESKGTRNTIAEAQKQGYKVKIRELDHRKSDGKVLQRLA